MQGLAFGGCPWLRAVVRAPADVPGCHARELRGSAEVAAGLLRWRSALAPVRLQRELKAARACIKPLVEALHRLLKAALDCAAQARLC